MKVAIYRLVLLAVLAFLLLRGDRMFASAMDDDIETAVKKSYVFTTVLKGDAIRIQSRDGAVTLSGTVSEEYSKSLARETILGLPGVVSVDNQLTMKSAVPSANSDGWLLAKVKSTLLFHRSVSAMATQVSVTGGVVVLRGQATSEAQIDLATEYARDVDGVKKVTNEMTVAPADVEIGGNPISEKRVGEKTMGDKMDAMGESVDDASTNALVKMALLSHRSTNALNTTAETKEGVVTLGGKARNAAEKDLATKLVSDVYGVKRVVNNMTIAGTEPKAANPARGVVNVADAACFQAQVAY
ncbi:BON domain-containing protein [Desulfovibrio sp. JY]|nr:BON domain-containing protein [Desulfovibrio sp. JY]